MGLGEDGGGQGPFRGDDQEARPDRDVPQGVDEPGQRRPPVSRQVDVRHRFVGSTEGERSPR